MLEVLRDGERTVGERIPEVGIELSQPSQQPGIMRRSNLVQTRKQGTSVVYSVGNTWLFELLDLARMILMVSLDEARASLEEDELEARPGRSKRPA